MKLGATDFVCKPFEDHELEVLIGSAIRQRQLSQEVASLRARLNEQSKYSTLFGNSDRMSEVRGFARQLGLSWPVEWGLREEMERTFGPGV